MDEECMEAVYSEDYWDYIIEYYGNGESIPETYGTSCYQLIANYFGVIYNNTRTPGELERIGAVLPRCFGLMSSDELLEETGIRAVQRIPGLSLYGQGVMIGIIDTGDGVRYPIKRMIVEGIHERGIFC